MAQSQKAKEKIQPQKEVKQPQLESNQQTQTPASRQAGANQPQHTQESGQQGSQSLSPSRGGWSDRGLARREQFMSPFSFMRRFSEEMDRLFEDFGFGGSLLGQRFGQDFLSPRFGRDFEQSMWSPQTEVFQRGSDLVVRADLPGMTKDDINIDVEDDLIVIRGERRDERESSEEGFYHTERSYGSFSRSIPLPPGINADQANATFNNGVLEITMPLPEQKSRGRRIEIGQGGAAADKPQGKSANQ